MKWTFFAGLGLGTAVGMLIAPKSGADLRDDVQEFARDSMEQVRERLEPLVDQAQKQAEPVVNQASARVDTIVDELFEGTEEARDTVSERFGDLTERVWGSGLMSILNEWPHERLIEIDGIGPVLATRIIQNRPYESEQELIESKELPPSAIESLRKAA
jgi:gas vesicle protein